MRRVLLYTFLLLLITRPVLAKPPQVLVSIKPIHSLVSSIMRGISSPLLLLEGVSTPHSYSLRPSDARKLAAADLVIWIGPELEGFLEKPLRTLKNTSQQLQLLEQPTLLRLPQRSGGFWDHASDHQHDHSSSPGKRGIYNPHLWLDPINAQSIAHLISQRLEQLDPANIEKYRHNTTKLLQKLKQLNQDLATRLAPVAAIPYLVFHDAYPYLEKRYQLSALGSVTISPERQPGAQRVGQILDKIKATKARCIFSEPQFQPGLVRVLEQETGIHSGILDPLGSDLEEGPDAYEQLMSQLAENLVSCLTQP